MSELASEVVLRQVLEELHELRRKVEKIEALLESRLLPVEEASEDDAEAIEAGMREYREGKTLSHEEVSRLLRRENTR